MEIVCTIGPATFSPSMIRMLWCAGVTVFRLNLSHTQSLEEIDKFTEIVRNETDGKTCLDTHGMKFCSPSDTALFTKFDIKVLKYSKSDVIVDQVAVSFAQSVEAIQKARELSGNKYVIAKIESKAGFDNKERIIAEADAVLIDRGDLSRSVPIEEIPRYCREIILTCKGLKTPVWVATNLLESMVGSPHPTMGEVNDIASLLLQGVDGLVLAAETAIGNYPIQCVEFVRRMIEVYSCGDNSEKP
ncbi:MAG: pyruvate kinase [Methylococcaceae bacterium]